MASNEDLYEVLQVSPNAEPEVIDAAYRRLAFKYHPDRHAGSAEAAARMARINKAYEVIKSTHARAAYDRRRASARHGWATRPPTARSRTSPSPSPEPPPRPKPPPPPRPSLPQPPRLEDFGLTEWSAKYTRFLTETLPTGVWRLVVLIATPLVPIYLAGGIEQIDLNDLTALPVVAWVAGFPISFIGGMVCYGLLSFTFKLAISGRVRQLATYRGAREAWRLALHKQLTDFWQSLSGDQFTEEVSRLFTQCGYRVAPIRYGSGADLLLERQGISMIAQCHNRDSQLTSEDVLDLQDQLKASGIRKGLIVSNKPLLQLKSDQALRHARRKPIRLVDESQLQYIQEKVLEGRPDLATHAIQR